MGPERKLHLTPLLHTGSKAFAASLKADTEKWARIVKEAGVKVE